MAEQLVRFLDLPGIAEIERLLGLPALMKDETEQLEAAIDEASLRLFCITYHETAYYAVPRSHRPATPEEWELNFAFLEEDEWEEEQAFWLAFGLDMTHADGDVLACTAVLGRQLICAMRQLLPAATLTFKADVPKTDAQLDTEAEAWGRSLRASSSLH